MIHKIIFTSAILLTLNGCDTQNNSFNGEWKLKISNSKDVYNSGALLRFDMNKLNLSGYDSCNQIGGSITKEGKNNYRVEKLTSTRMACRSSLNNEISQQIHTLLKEGFSINKSKIDNHNGLMLKSPNYELFFIKN